jgi:diaminopimelate epimerase
LRFTKMQGVGNDFVVVDGRERSAWNWPEVAIRLCDRRFGIGADGLLVLEPSESADFRMRMHNPDGSSDVCGNGLRCVARYAFERGVHAASQMRIETLAGIHEANLLLDASGLVSAVRVHMGQPLFAPGSIPMRVDLPDGVKDFPLALPGGESLLITALSTGSTHAVTFVEDMPDDARFLTVSPQVEQHPLFPERTSLMWCRVADTTELHLRIWERGAGETWGCGTGACAAAVAAIQKQIAPADTPIRVISKGGTLEIRWQPGDVIAMTGPAENVFEGQIALPEEPA